MPDLIDREDAVKVLLEKAKRHRALGRQATAADYDECAAAIRALPAAPAPGRAMRAFVLARERYQDWKSFSDANDAWVELVRLWPAALAEAKGESL